MEDSTSSGGWPAGRSVALRTSTSVHDGAEMEIPAEQDDAMVTPRNHIFRGTG